MIQNIIFDFGNVLFDLDLAAFEREMKNLWGENFAAAKEKLLRERVFELYETGGLSTAEFVEKLCGVNDSVAHLEGVPHFLNDPTPPPSSIPVQKSSLTGWGAGFYRQ